MTDQPTTIAMRDIVTRQRAFRLDASEFDSFDDLVQRTYAGFRRHPRDFMLHIHFRPDTPCMPNQLLNAREWDAGEYFVGGRIEFFAHFVERGAAANRAERFDGREHRVARAGTMPVGAGDRCSRAPTTGLRLPPPPLGAQRGS